MKNKKGLTTIFLSIIISALILIETTYIAYVADLDRRLTLTRAIKSQGEVYLAQYDRTLFKTYGIYAFNTNALNDNVFNDVLSVNGYEVGETMCVSGVYQFDTEDLRRVVASYYTYRASGILVDRFAEQIFAVIESIDEYGVINYLHAFTSSSASNLINQIIDRGVTIAQDISDSLEEIGIDINSNGYQFFINLISSLGQIRNNTPDFGNGFSPSDISGVSSTLENVISLYESSSEFIDNYGLHLYLADYASYNFDTRLLGDTTINGLEFTNFHSDNLSDTEYILTGLSGYAANIASYYAIFGLLVIENTAFFMLDNSKREIIASAGEVLAAIVSVLTGGSVSLPPIVYEVLIAVIWAEIESFSNIYTLLDGGTVNFLEINGIEALSLDYRDFLTALMFYVPDNLLLERITNIINRDFSDYCTGFAIESSFGARTLHYESTYELYE